MIRKEEVDVRELNRKVHARAQLKPERHFLSKNFPYHLIP